MRVSRLITSKTRDFPDLGVDPDGAVASVRWDVAMLDRDYAAARRAINASPAKELSYMGEGSTPRSFFEGLGLRMNNVLPGKRRNTGRFIRSIEELQPKPRHGH